MSLSDEIREREILIKSWIKEDITDPNKNCVDFNILYKWMKYSDKDVAKRALKGNLKETEYIIKKVQSKGKNGVKNKPSEHITLTLANAIKFIKLAPPSKGKDLYNLILRVKKLVEKEEEDPLKKETEEKYNEIYVKDAIIKPKEEHNTSNQNEIKTTEIKKKVPLKSRESNVLQKESAIISLIINSEPINEITSDLENQKSAILKSSDSSNQQNVIIQYIEPNLNNWLELDLKEPGGFHVDFDPIWKGLGYSTKQKAKDSLVQHFQHNLDYQSTLRLIGKNGGKPKEIIKLTTTTTKEFCLMAQTSSGQLIRKYFIEQENKFRLLKQNLNNGNLELKNVKTGEIYTPQGIHNIQITEKINSFSQFMEPLISDFYNKPVNYLINIGKHAKNDIQAENGEICDSEEYFKFGETKNFEKRYLQHIKIYGLCKIIKIWKCNNREDAESEFKLKMTELKLIRKLNISSIKDINSVKYKKEIIITTKETPLDRVIEIMDKIVSKHNIHKEHETIELKHQLEIEKLKHEKEIMQKESKEKEKDKEIELLKAQLEIQNLKHQLEILALKK